MGRKMERNVVGAHEGGGCTPIIWQEGTPGIMMRCGTKTGEYSHRAAVQGVRSCGHDGAVTFLERQPQRGAAEEAYSRHREECPYANETMGADVGNATTIPSVQCEVGRRYCHGAESTMLDRLWSRIAAGY